MLKNVETLENHPKFYESIKKRAGEESVARIVFLIVMLWYHIEHKTIDFQEMRDQ